MKLQWALGQLTRVLGVVSRRAMWVVVAVLTVAAASGVVAEVGHLRANAAMDRTTTYKYDPVAERWVRSEETVRLPPNQDGTQPQGSNTIVIELRANDPVKEITIDEALIIGGTQPLLEIAGQSGQFGSGKLRICTLTFDTVEAERLDIDADVVRVKIENVVAEDNELDLDLEVVNVVRCGRGAASVLKLGVVHTLDDKDSNNNGNGDGPRVSKRGRETGLRVDRIRILGPQSSVGFVENLTVIRSSVFGRIEVRDVEIQELVLKNVSLDDSP
ncbi:MAG: hypothetical protein HYY01_04695 [Chloroflexi bacterium]|nr:hypothetical protein [Chloroflexota bacterium]